MQGGGATKVVVVSGWFGAGKTTLLLSLLKSLPKTLRVAIVSNCISEVSIDRVLLEGLAPSPSVDYFEVLMGCACCEAREALVSVLKRIAEAATFDYVFIEPAAEAHPLHVASCIYDLRLKGTLQLDLVVSVVDAAHFLEDYGQGKQDNRRLEVMKANLEFAQLILLNKVDAIESPEELSKLESAIELILKNVGNTNAKRLNCKFGGVPLSAVLNTTLFSLEAAKKNSQWATPRERGAEYTVSFVYRSRKPFHPDRLLKVLGSNVAQFQVTRAKGLAWLTTRNDRWGIWNQPSLHPSLAVDITGGGRWVVDMPKEYWPREGSVGRLNWLNDEIGDRRQEIVFLQAGLKPALDEVAIRRLLDACLIKPTEIGVSLPDRLPLWDRLPPSGGSLGEKQAQVEPTAYAVQFVRELRKGAKEVLTECRGLAELVDAKALARAQRHRMGDDEDFEEEEEEEDSAAHLAFKNCVVITSKLVDSIILPFLKANIQLIGTLRGQQMHKGSNDLKEAVVVFIRCCQDAINNPVDYMTNQKVKSALSRIGNAIQLLATLAKGISSQTKELDEKGQPAPTEGKSESEGGRKENVVQQVKLAAVALKDATDAVSEHSSLRFVSTTKTLIARCTSLIDLGANASAPSEQFFVEKKYLEDAMMSFVTCGRRIFTTTDGSDAGDDEWNDWEDAKRDLAKAIKQVSTAILMDLQKSMGMRPAEGKDASEEDRRRSAQLRDILPLSPAKDLVRSASAGSIMKDLEIDNPTASSTHTDPSSPPGRHSPYAKPKPAVPSKHTKPALSSRPSVIDNRRPSMGDESDTAGGFRGAYSCNDVGIAAQGKPPPIPSRTSKPRTSPRSPRGEKFREGLDQYLALRAAETNRPDQPVGPPDSNSEWNMTLRSKEREKEDTQQRIQAMNKYSEWRQMTLKRGLVSPVSSKLEDIQSPAEQLRTIINSYGSIILEFVISANEYALLAESEVKSSTIASSNRARSGSVLERTSAQTLGDAVSKLSSAWKVLLRLCNSAHVKCPSPPPPLEKILAKLEESVLAAPKKGVPDAKIIHASSTSHSVAINLRICHQQIFDQSNGMLMLGKQILGFLKSESFMGKGGNGPSFGSTLLYIAAALQTQVGSAVRLLNLVETSKAVASQKAEVEKSTKSSYGISAEALLDNLQDDVNIWEEGPEDFSNLRRGVPPGSDPSQPSIIMSASLNKLVETLTSDTEYDNRFLHTFITTYQSFTTPEKLFNKLMQRYSVPSSRVEQKRIPQIQLRVVVVLKYWVENQFFDFDGDMVMRIYLFIEQTLRNDNSQLATLLSNELDSRTALRTNQMKALFIQPEELEAPVVSALYQVFSNAKALDIAQQLTLVEFSIYSSIETSELLRQSWNKEDLQHNSPHVLAMINRANRLSFWVAGLILMMETPKERKEIFAKLLQVCEELEKFNNFHTLMGIIAGINTSPISRLAASKKKLKTKYSKGFRRLEDLMNPEGSFSNYRKRLHGASPPAIPYLGVYLSDLTFTEDGNPDKIDHLINFGKRRLVYRIIEEVKQYQVTPYNFTRNEPLYTFLADLPVLTEGHLFDLSLVREPRKTKK